MAVFNSNILAGASGQTSGAAAFQIDRSLRFNDGDSAYLNRTPSSAGNRRTFTWSGWVKRASFSGDQQLIYAAPSSSDTSHIRFTGTALHVFEYTTGFVWQIKTTRVFRDPSAWYHIVVAVDTTQSTASDRVKIYVNGVQETDFSSSSYPSQNADTEFNNNVAHTIGRNNGGSNNYLDGYLAEVHWIDGQQLAASDFGEEDDNGVWQPKEYSGTYGTPVNQAETWSSVIKAGSTTYSPSDSNTGFLSAYPATQAFDFATTSSVAYSDNNNVWIYFTPATALTVSSTIRFGARNTVEIKINGTDYSYTGGDTTGDQTIRSISFSGSLTEFAIRDDDNSGYSTGLSFLEIDGVLLVDNGVTVPDNSFYLKFADNSSNAALGTDSSGNDNDWTVNNLTAASFGWESTTWSDDISINSGNFYLNNNDGPNGFDGSSSTYIDCRLGSGSNNITNIIWEPTGGIAGVTKIRVHSEYASHYRINEGTWTSFSSGGSYTQIYSGTAFTLTKLEVRRDDNGGTDYGHRVTAYELNDIEVQDDLAQNDAYNIDSLIDTPTNYTADSGNNGGNYATLNPLDRKSTVSLSNGNLDATTSSTGWAGVKGTIGVSSGKYYFEATANGPAAYYQFFGICASSVKPDTSGYLQDDSTERAKGMLLFCDNGQYQLDGNSRVSYSSSMTDGDVIAIAYDLDNNTVQFYKNGSALGSIDISSSPLASATVVPLVIRYNTNTTYHLNFGQRPFAYTPPTGYKSLCTQNLADPTIADGSTAFDIQLWTGNAADRSITGYNFSPDFAWIKDRSGSYNHGLFDTVRGPTKRLSSSTAGAETTYAESLTSFDSNGFSLGDNSDSNNTVNINNNTYVGWAWDAGSSTVSNTDGSLDSDVRVNQTAGFSIVKYTSGSGSQNDTVGHGLNAVPEFILLKRIDGSDPFVVSHKDVAVGDYLELNSTSGTQTSASVFETAHTSSVFGIGTDGRVNAGGNSYIAYCFAPVAGYSAFGSYTGNGSADGPFAALSFRPSWVMIKRLGEGDWRIWDTSRDPINVADNKLYPNKSNAETGSSDTNEIDILSNGFKLRSSVSEGNASGDTYIYVAFAENPFQANGGLAR